MAGKKRRSRRSPRTPESVKATSLHKAKRVAKSCGLIAFENYIGRPQHWGSSSWTVEAAYPRQVKRIRNKLAKRLSRKTQRELYSD